MCRVNALIRVGGGGRDVMKARATRLAVNSAPAARRVYDVILALSRNGSGELNEN